MPAGPPPSLAAWIAWFLGLCAGLVAVVVLVLWLSGGFADAGLSAHGWVALALGIVLTAALAIGLMALVFFSDRSDADARTRLGSGDDARR